MGQYVSLTYWVPWVPRLLMGVYDLEMIYIATKGSVEVTLLPAICCLNYELTEDLSKRTKLIKLDSLLQEVCNSSRIVPIIYSDSKIL